jgi:hypothetical protein
VGQSQERRGRRGLSAISYFCDVPFEVICDLLLKLSGD